MATELIGLEDNFNTGFVGSPVMSTPDGFSLANDFGGCSDCMSGGGGMNVPFLKPGMKTALDPQQFAQPVKGVEYYTAITDLKRAARIYGDVNDTLKGKDYRGVPFSDDGFAFFYDKNGNTFIVVYEAKPAMKNMDRTAKLGDAVFSRTYAFWNGAAKVGVNTDSNGEVRREECPEVAYNWWSGNTLSQAAKNRLISLCSSPVIFNARRYCGGDVDGGGYASFLPNDGIWSGFGSGEWTVANVIAGVDIHGNVLDSYEQNSRGGVRVSFYQLMNLIEATGVKFPQPIVFSIERNDVKCSPVINISSLKNYLLSVVDLALTLIGLPETIPLVNSAFSALMSGKAGAAINLETLSNAAGLILGSGKTDSKGGFVDDVSLTSAGLSDVFSDAATYYGEISNGDYSGLASKLNLSNDQVKSYLGGDLSEILNAGGDLLAASQLQNALGKLDLVNTIPAGSQTVIDDVTSANTGSTNAVVRNAYITASGGKPIYAVPNIGDVMGAVARTGQDIHDIDTHYNVCRVVGSQPITSTALDALTLDALTMQATKFFATGSLSGTSSGVFVIPADIPPPKCDEFAKEISKRTGGTVITAYSQNTSTTNNVYYYAAGALVLGAIVYFATKKGK